MKIPRESNEEDHDDSDTICARALRAGVDYLGREETLVSKCQDDCRTR
jgi:hypothetical protein